MVEVSASIAMVVIIVAMSTLGAVLLVRFFMTRADTATRTFAAAFLGPMLVLLPVIAFMSASGDDVLVGLVGLAFVVVTLFAIIGYPISHFATRRLDKLTEFRADIFE